MTQETQKTTTSENETKRLPNSRLYLWINIYRHYDDRGEITRLLGWNCTNSWWKLGKINFSNSNISPLASRYDMSHMRCFSYWLHQKTARCHFRVIWHDWRNHLFTHSLTVSNLLFSSLLSLRLKKPWTFLFSLFFSIFKTILSRIMT